MKSKIILAAAIISIIITNSCKDTGTGPQTLEPGRRDYVWTVDTLDMPMNLIGTIWGSSPNDVWTTGAGGDSEDRLLHYNGVKWETYKKEPIHCAGNTLFGFSSDNIWMGGNNDGRIWHYDGNKWSEYYRYIVDGSYDVGINNIWGKSANDLYACGSVTYFKDGKNSWHGFVLHYNGTSWTEITRVDFNSQFISIRCENNDVFLFALKTSTEVCDTVAFYKLNGKNLQEIFSEPEDKIEWGGIHVINGKVYFLITQDLFSYVDGNFKKQFSLAHQNFGYQFYGRNEKDIFIAMKDGIAHFNGTDIKYLYYFLLNTRNILNEPAMFKEEIFFCMYEGSTGRNMVLHGKLKE